MKAIKKTAENLKKVCDSIVNLHLSDGSFSIDYSSSSCDTISLFSCNRDAIGSSILGMIPSNFTYRVNFISTGTRLTIWFN